MPPGTDPFAYVPPASEPVTDDGGPGRVTLRCKTCRGDLARERGGHGNWVHADDEVVVKGATLVSVSKYDHPPKLDVIDVEVIEEIDSKYP